MNLQNFLDGLALLLAGIVVSAAAWLLLSSLGPDAGLVLSIITMVWLGADNKKLRERLRALEKEEQV